VRHSRVGRPAPGPPGPALSHLDREGRARMVDVSEKPVTAREAVARGRIRITAAAMRLARSGRLAKGGVVEVARLAGILAAKRTAEAIPLCHSLPLGHVDVDLQPRRDGFSIEARVRTDARTGAEMEALHAVAVAALTVYDMVKAADRGMSIGPIELVRKSGGRSGEWRRPRARASGSGGAGRPRRGATRKRRSTEAR
jgi:cyclic pyranopterin monophosphate synthase